MGGRAGGLQTCPFEGRKNLLLQKQLLNWLAETPQHSVSSDIACISEIYKKTRLDQY